MVERRSPKPNVEGSSPSWPVILKNEVFMAKIGTFWKECIGELRKVVWPSQVFGHMVGAVFGAGEYQHLAQIGRAHV